jgi:tRNA nucleotidyltransferase (CCA-adding enzyme)
VKEMNLPKAVEFAFKKIMDAGGQAYLVGGALRDRMLGKPVTDYDIASSFLPGQIEKIFSGEKTWPSGKRFGTITVKIDNTAVEITTFRKDSAYSDSRHPDHVTYISDICQDLARRDFTINAMAYNPYISDGLVDPFGGRKDLQNRVIRAVGNPVERFTEDPLRIMRGIRFSAQLGFEIEWETKQAMKTCYHLLSKVAAERLRSELDNLLLSANPDKGLLLLQETGILACMFMFKDKGYCEAEDYQMIKNMEAFPAYRLSALFSMLYSAGFSTSDILDSVKDKLIQLRYDKKTIHQILKMLNGYSAISNMDITPFSVREFLGKMGIQDTKQCIRWYKEAQKIHKNPSAVQRAEKASSLLKDIIRRGDAVFSHQLAINGKHVLQAGIGLQNPRIVGEALDLAYRWVLEDPSRNQPDCLIAMLKEYYSNL